MWPGGTPHVVVGTLKISLDRLKLHPKWKEKQKYSNEKPPKCMCMPKVSFPVWDDLLKFDTTAWNSYHWSIYCASTKTEPELIHSYCTGPYICHHEMGPMHGDTGFYSAQTILKNMEVVTFAKDENIRFFFKPLLTWVMIKNVDTSVTTLNFILTCSSGALYNN